MNRRLALKIVRCLRTTGCAASDLAGLQTCTRENWLDVLPWLHTSGLALYLLRTLREQGQGNLLPPDVRRRLELNQANNRLRAAAMVDEFAVLNRCFEDAGIRYAALKGFALTPDYSPHASLRAQADFDYLVAPESRSHAEEALRAAGYVRQGRGESNPAVFSHSARPLRIPASDDDLYSAALPRRLELHTRLWNPGPDDIHPQSLETALDRTRLHLGQGLRFPVLAGDDALVFQILHALRHIFDFWCRLSLLLEIAYFLERRAHDVPFWQRFVTRLDADSGLPAAAGAVFMLARRLFGASLPGELSAWIQARTPRAMVTWVQHYGQDCALENFMGNKFSLFLRREFIPDAASWHGILRRRLFPFHRPNQAAEASSPRMSSHLAAGVKQTTHVLRRFKFHLVSGLRLGWEFPRWERLRRSASAVENARGKAIPEPVSTVVPLRLSEPRVTRTGAATISMPSELTEES